MALLDANQVVKSVYDSAKNALRVSGAARKVAVTYSATPTFDLSKGNLFTMTLTGSITSMTLSNPVAGQSYTLLFTQDGTGGRTISWASGIRWPSGTAPTLSAANKTDKIELIYNGTYYLGRYDLNYTLS